MIIFYCGKYNDDLFEEVSIFYIKIFNIQNSYILEYEYFYLEKR